MAHRRGGKCYGALRIANVGLRENAALFLAFMQTEKGKKNQNGDFLFTEKELLNF
jgi:hypothetical protein